MKTKILLLLIIASFVGIGCSSKKTEATPPAADIPAVVNPVDPGAPGGGGTGGSAGVSGGDVVSFTYVDFQTFEAYVGLNPLNSPKDIKLSINLSEGEEKRFKGTVKISYEDNGQIKTGTFESGMDKNYQGANMRDNEKYQYHYNYWFMNNNTQVFSGFFQDKLGSIVVVIDKSLDQGDGQGSAYVSGSVYFKNFPQMNINYNPQTGRSNEQPWERKCWFIYAGPYVCGSGTVMGKTGLYPTTAEGYRKLGSFAGLSRVKAFNLK